MILLYIIPSIPSSQFPYYLQQHCPNCKTLSNIIKLLYIYVFEIFLLCASVLHDLHLHCANIHAHHQNTPSYSNLALSHQCCSSFFIYHVMSGQLVKCWHRTPSLLYNQTTLRITKVCIFLLSNFNLHNITLLFNN